MLTHRLDATGPFNWLGSARTLEENLTQTMTERLNGVGLEGRELKALTRFVRDGLRPVVQPAPKEPELVAMGRELFNDATVRHAEFEVDRAHRSVLSRRLGRLSRGTDREQ